MGSARHVDSSRSGRGRRRRHLAASPSVSRRPAPRRLLAAGLVVVATGAVTAWGPVQAGTFGGGPVAWYRTWTGGTRHHQVAAPGTGTPGQAPSRRPRRGAAAPVGDAPVTGGSGTTQGGSAGGSEVPSTAPAPSGDASATPPVTPPPATTPPATTPPPTPPSGGGAGGGSGGGSGGPAPAPDPAAGSASARIFSASSVQSARLAPGAALAGDSASTVAKLARQAAYTRASSPVAGYFDAPFNTYLATFVPVYTVPAGTPRMPVTWVDDSGQPVDPAATGLGGSQPLQQWLDEGVPIPADAEVGSGSDAELAVWQPSTDTYWEFWQLRPVRGTSGKVTGWTCRYGGRIAGASRSDGVFAHRQGAGATSIAYGGLQIRAQDWAAGRIDHALALQLPVTASRFVAPATRNDSFAAVPSGDARDAVPEGTRFRLPSTFDPAAYAPGGDDRSTLLRMILTAARDYGVYVVDTTGGTMNLVAEPDSAYGTAYSIAASKVPSWWEGEGMFWGSGGVAQRIPWNQLQVVAP